MAEEPELHENLSISPVKKNKKKIIGGLILGGIPILFILYLVIGPILDILSKDIKAKEMFVVSEFVNVRATSDINSLKMGKLEYGTQVLVYEIKEDWAEVLVDRQKVFCSSKFLVEPAVYYSIEGFFGDERSSKLINSSKYRLALFRYYESKGITGEMPEDIQKKFFKDSVQKECYQIFSEPKGSAFNSTCFADFDGDHNQDAAFLLKHKNSDKKIMLIISFDSKDPLEQSNTIFEYELDKPWMFIKLAKKGSKFDISKEGEKGENVKIPVNGILIGSNRSKELKDPSLLLYYNGQKFEIYHLAEKIK
jgi:hypothetical protein